MPGKRASRPDVRINRRDLVTAALIAQVPLLGPVDTAEAGENAGETEPPADPRELRYRETAHVRSYYERNRF